MSILFLLNLNVLYLVSLMDFSSKFVVVENLLLDKGVRAKILFLFLRQRAKNWVIRTFNYAYLFGY